MGATNFLKTGYGTDPRMVFDELVKQAEYERGHDIYSGTIYTCRYAGCRKITDSYTASADKKARKLIEDEDYGEKWSAKALDLGVVKYEIVRVKKIIPKFKKKAEYKLRYAVMIFDENSLYPNVHSHFATKTEADEEAIKLLLQNPDSKCFVAKKMVNVNNGVDHVTEFHVEVSERKSKPKTIPKGCIMREIHKYIFYGWAPE